MEPGRITKLVPCLALLCGSACAQILPGILNPTPAASGSTITYITSGLHSSTGTMLNANWPTPLNATGANFLVVVEALYQHAPTVSPSDSQSNTWTQCGTDIQTTTGAQINLGVWYVANASVSSSQSFGLGGVSTSYSSMYVAAFSGLSSSPCTSAFSKFAASSVGSTVQPGSITPAANGSLIISSPAAFYTGAAWTATINDGFTVAQSGSTTAVGTGGGIGYLVQTTAAAINPTWTESAGSAMAAALQVAFK